MTAPIRYARSGDVNIAYQVTGEGPFDVVLVHGFFSHLEIDWELPALAHFHDRLGSFARLIRLDDKRGTGLSDRGVGLPDFAFASPTSSSRRGARTSTTRRCGRTRTLPRSRGRSVAAGQR